MNPDLFDRMLEPLGAASFIDDHWARTPVLLQDRDPAVFEGLFDLDSLEEYLFTARPALPMVQLVKRSQWPEAQELRRIMDGPDYSIQGAFRALDEGYTVVLNAVHERWAPVRRLVLEVEERLLCTAQVNVYITGRESQGFNVHIDEHDVFVVQTFGAKHWVVYDKPDGPTDRGELLYDVDLSQGELLYLPTGYPHAAATAGDYSIHLALGVFQYTWQELLADLLGHVAAGRPELQEAVPLSLLRGEESPERAVELAADLASRLGETDDLGSLVEAYCRRHTIANQTLNPAPSGYVRSAYGVGDATPTTRISRRPGVNCKVQRSGATAVISFLGETITMPARVEKALRFIADSSTFTVQEIPGEFSDDSRLVLVRRLVREGLLQLATD